MARRRRLLPDGDRPATACWAQQALARAELSIRRFIDAGGDDARWELAAAAAQTLEACAATWETFGPAAGERHVRLGRCLERHLAAHEQSVSALEAGYRLAPDAVTVPAQAAGRAIGRLSERRQDTAVALAELEDGALWLATVAVRGVANIDATGCANGRGGRARAPDRVSLQARFAEIDAHAETLLDPRDRGDVATWLSECLIIVTPSIHATPRGESFADQAADGVDRRRRWLRLGARELLIAHCVTRGTAAPLDPCSGQVVCAAAADVLADTGLARRTGAFDAMVAWERQSAALSTLIPACASALNGDTDAARRVRSTLVDRLARIVGVLWLIDHQSPRTRRQGP